MCQTTKRHRRVACTAKSMTWFRSRSVSYTHLDVYKRQEHFLTDEGRDALAKSGVQPGVAQ